MAALVSSAGLGLMPAHGQRAAVFLWIVVLITMTNADSPVSEEPHLNSTSSFMKNQTGSSLSAFQSSHITIGNTPTESSGPHSTHEARTTDIKLKEENITSFSSSENYNFTPTSSPLKFEVSTNPQPRVTNKTAYTNMSWSNTAPQSEPSTPSLLTVSSFPGQSLEPSKASFSDYQADHVIPYPDAVTSSNIWDTNQLSPSIAPSFSKTPYTPPLAASYNVLFASPHPRSTLSAPTDLPLDDVFPTDNMDIDWGSGDYLETMSYMGADGGDYSLVTKVPTEMFDMDENMESYDTSFPTRVGISPTSMHPFQVSHSPSLTTTDFSTHFTIEATPSFTFPNEIAESSAVDWSDHFAIEPTDVLLPDMNSLEYYTTQKENSDGGAEQRGNVTIVAVSDITPTISSENNTKANEEESSSEMSGSEPAFETTEKTLETVSNYILDPSITASISSSMWTSEIATSTSQTDSSVLNNATSSLPDDVIAYTSLTDVHWFVTEPFGETTIQSTPALAATVAFSTVPTDIYVSSTTFTTAATPQNTTSNLYTTNATASNVTSVPPVLVGDQATTEDGVDIPATLTLLPESTEADTSFTTASTTDNTTPRQDQGTPKLTTVTEVSEDVSIKDTIRPPTTQTPRQYLCDIDKPEYLVKISFPSGATIGYAKLQVRDILKAEFNKSVELQVVEAPPEFVFRVVSGPFVYTAISVINALQRSGRRFLSISPNWTTPDYKYQVHTVLQFVPSHVDVRFCNFSESIETGLTRAYAEVCRRSKESTNFTVHIVNITNSPPKTQEQLMRQPVDIIFTVRGSRGHLMGSEVSNSLLKLTMVEFSYYMGFPVLQIAEPFHYPELNTSQVLRSSWVKTVLLGVLDQKMSEKTFQANMERRVAMLLGEAMGVRRVKRATSVGNTSVQVVSTSRLAGADNPLEIVYFVEGPNGERIPAVRTAGLLNGLDVQRAAIVLGYRVQGVLALPVEKVATTPSENVNTNLWVIIGVVIPLLVVIIIISILYWKLCRTDKLEFQPDAMSSMQQRQKLQTSSVKGFDFAKLHLGQQSKDDVMVIQEPSGPAPLPMSIKDGLSPSENGEVPTPISKGSSTKASHTSQRRERISPSDGDSVVTDHSSERESTEDNLRGHSTPSDVKHTRKLPINVLNGKCHHSPTQGSKGGGWENMNDRLLK